MGILDYTDIPGALMPVDTANIAPVPGGGYLVHPSQAQAFNQSYPQNTQMQAASLIPHNPKIGDLVSLVFNGTQWIRMPVQAASLIPHNPKIGDMVSLVFNGTQWVKAGSAEELGAMVAEKLPASGESFSLEDIAGAEAFIEEINANRAEAHP